ncbi:MULTISPECIES: restriction endonuclease [unclassified Streptomyces]|uniref:restriction endonuclease n=1 Tax=unclassified Streptomyces TaxID=2593676 RepID=UPI00035DD446|nr:MULTISPECIES: restriction endonuclease [unclassified Streptomyces]MYT30082.1 restriction endonuclease [Streptomyces sp. SID8354]
MATPARRRHPTSRRTTRPSARRPSRRPARRPTRRPRGRAARRRAHERALTRLVLAALALGAVVAAARAYPVTTLVLGILATAAATLFLLARAGRLRLPDLVRSHQDVTHTLAAYQRMTGPQFEHAVADLARRDPAVRSATVSGGANDRGLDVLVVLHDGRRIAVQCKRYAEGNRVGAPAIYTANGTYRAYHRCDHAVIVTTSRFTRDAELANASLPEPLRLIDGRGLARWIGGGRPPWAT